MNSKKRAFLKKKAHNLEPMVRIGKDGLNENIIQSILITTKKIKKKTKSTTKKNK